MAPAALIPSADSLARRCDRHHLTGRECVTVRLLAIGCTNKEIAAQMNVSVNTVKVFMHKVMLKLKVTTRAGIIGRLFADDLWGPTSG
jgi:DNA-binding NarL/FixJ family response regulator